MAKLRKLHFLGKKKNTFNILQFCGGKSYFFEIFAAFFSEMGLAGEFWWNHIFLILGEKGPFLWQKIIFKTIR